MAVKRARRSSTVSAQPGNASSVAARSGLATLTMIASSHSVIVVIGVDLPRESSGGNRKATP
jgi:hypothetical protein